MSLMSVGRLFQTSGPLTENARRPNCVLVRPRIPVASASRGVHDYAPAFAGTKLRVKIPVNDRAKYTMAQKFGTMLLYALTLSKY